MSSNNHVALFVSGGIAVYKACEVLRNLQKAGCEVRVCMTESATKMVGPKTFEALSGNHVVLDLFEDEQSAIPHIELAEWADIALVCPATANIMAKMAHGIADDAASSTLLALTCPVVVAPAMNVHMWQNAATQDNVELLRERGIFFAGPVAGHLACGTEGIGKLADVDAISSYVLSVMAATQLDLDSIQINEMNELPLDGIDAQEYPHIVPQDLCGKKVVVTAGPTHEAIDPVRYLANASSGKMGFAIASAAAVHGAEVVLVSGPTSLPDPLGVETIHVTSARQMLEAVQEAFEDADAAILSAAVCDYTPKTVSDHKLKKANERLDVLELTETQDILATISAAKGNRVVIGFAAETNDIVANAQSKLTRKGCDLIVANDVSQSVSTFGSDTNKVVFVGADSVLVSDIKSKGAIAEDIMSELVARLWDNKG